ncbi:MAG: ribosome assembly cofactor RimP [Tannerella sp.]|jgi:ribosome maturation factor RimP|nr:ribosome assembly cofactor RimP [Tannerella sp.]
MIEKEKIVRLTQAYLTDSDCYLVDVAVKPGNLIVVEIDHDEAVSIDDCVDLNQYIESKLDREEEDFELEVGSSGITSPFKIQRQYTKNRGNEVEVLLKNGTKKTGILQEADENTFVLTVAKQIKPEGEKRKRTVYEDEKYTYDEIKYTKNIIRFK